MSKVLEITDNSLMVIPNITYCKTIKVTVSLPNNL